MDAGPQFEDWNSDPSNCVRIGTSNVIPTPLLDPRKPVFARPGVAATGIAVGACNGGNGSGGADGFGSCVGVGAGAVGLAVGGVALGVGVEGVLIGRAATDAGPAASAGFTDFWPTEADPLVSGAERGDTSGSAVFFGTPVGTIALPDCGVGLLSVGSDVCFGFV